jgi:hypothetical protein
VVVNVVKSGKAQSFDFHAMEIAGKRASRVFWCPVVCNKWMWICAVLFLALSPLISHAQDTVLATEPPQVRALLNEAMALERSASNFAEIRRAATLYCKASRLGSIEAQYRLGLLYLYGRGVPKNIDFASSLFSQAAQQGHAKALNMLEAVRLRSLKLPPCLV